MIANDLHRYNVLYKLLLYISGPASIEDIAKQVISCQGPSGTNKEYVYNLAKAMRHLLPGIEDDHLFSLEAALKKIDPDAKKK